MFIFSHRHAAQSHAFTPYRLFEKQQHIIVAMSFFVFFVCGCTLHMDTLHARRRSFLLDVSLLSR